MRYFSNRKKKHTQNTNISIGLTTTLQLGTPIIKQNKQTNKTQTMNTFLQVLLAATVLVSSASSSTLRGSTVRDQDESQSHYQRALRELSSFVPESEHHRHLTEETKCRLYLQVIDYPPTEEHPRGYSVDEWICFLRLDDEYNSDIDSSHPLYVDIVDPESVDGNVIVGTARSGFSTLLVSEAILDVKQPKMYIPMHAQVKVVDNDDDDDNHDDNDNDNSAYNYNNDNDSLAAGHISIGHLGTHQDINDYNSNSNNNQRRTSTTSAVTGNLKTLVVRVTAIDSEVTAKPNQLFDNIFTDDSCLATQYKACSYGKLTMQPYKGTTVDNQPINGIVDVKVGVKLAKNDDVKNLQYHAVTETYKAMGGAMPHSEIDLVLFCFPPGSGGWAAYAMVNERFSYYNNEACSSVSAQLHEVGHNLGLGHSGGGKTHYDDTTGFMGESYNEDDTHMCFNPAKNYQLGWYDDKVVDYNPLTHRDAVRTFVVNGVSDYKNSISKANIVVRLEMPDKTEDFYIGFNRKTGINRDTKGDGDRITVVRKEIGLPKEYGMSIKHAALSIGQFHVLENFNNEQNRSIRIKYDTNTNNGRDATITITDITRANEVPIPCAEYVVELKTDNFPNDNSWVIIEDGGTGQSYGANPEYNEKNKLYTTTVCLPYNKKYIFRIVDTYKDGLCCNQGEGSFRGLDQDGRQLFAGGKYNPREFHVDEFKISVGPNPEPDPEFPEVDSDDENHEGVVVCKDRKGKFDWSGNSKKRKRNCRWIAKKKKCGKTDGNGEKVWRHCPKKCGYSCSAI
uniref:Peptidase M11 gametolysin domain-containing protein n=1 Tax=Pseudo-nitzschia australis TaxID=44445 RepID=A0A7S4AK27_9STRA